MKDEQQQSDGIQEVWRFRLYIAGKSPRSVTAVSSLKKICQEYFHDDYDLEIIDLWEQPELAQEDKILATPTLLRLAPLPVRKIIGDLSQTDKVLAVFDI